MTLLKTIATNTPSDESGFKGNDAYETRTLMSGCRRPRTRVPCSGFPSIPCCLSTVACAKAGNHHIKPLAFSSLRGDRTPPPQTGILHNVCICTAL